MNKKILALLLVFSLLFAISPAFAIALDTPAEPLPTETQTIVETETPETEAPIETEIPETETPVETEIPETETPVETETPETGVPETEVPVETETPETEAPVESEAPETEAPVETEIPEAEEPVEIPEEDVPGAETPEWTELYAALLAAESIDEVDALLGEMSEEDVLAFLDSLTGEQYDTLMAHLAALEEQEMPEEGDPAVDFTEAGPFLPPVTGPAMRRGLTAPAMRTTDGAEDALVTSKTVSDPVDKVYTLTLEAYATGEKIVIPPRAIPADIVLVLDQSGSMGDYALSVPVGQADKSNPDYYRYGSNNRKVRYNNEKERWEYNSSSGSWKNIEENETLKMQRLQALKNAVTDFVESVRDKAVAADVDHRIAIVGFASENDYGKNTEILTVSGTNSGTVGVAYGSGVTDAIAKAALVSSTDPIVDEAINALTANGATRADLGMKLAKKVLDNNPVNSGERSRVVIMFTDGTPTSHSTFDFDVANGAISYSKNLKDAGTTVYTIGIFNGANPGLLSPNENKFMNYTSSNYPKASSMTNDGTQEGGKRQNGYYLSSGSTSGLNNIFQNIAGYIEGSTPVELDRTAVVKDTISEYFELAGDKTTSIRAYTVDYLGMSDGLPTWGEIETPHAFDYGPDNPTDPDYKTISVTGFNFQENYIWDNEDIAPGHGGKKLVIEIDIKARPEFWGGNNVPTNEDDSGVYTGGGSPFETFEVPEANVPLIVLEVSKKDQNIYAGNTPPELKDLVTLEAPYVEDWRTAYVDVTYTEINDKSVDRTKSDTYNIQVLVNPLPDLTGDGAAGDAVVAGEYDATATVTVFKPVVTFQDSKIELGDTADYKDNFYQKDLEKAVVWMNGTTPSTDPTIMMTGDKPQLTFAYDPEAGVFTSDKNVRVTAVTHAGNGFAYLSDDPEFTYVTFGWEKNPTACDDTAAPDHAQFRVHVNGADFDLTIKKTVDESKPTQSFIFDIEDGKGFSMSVVLSPKDFNDGKAEVTIYGVPNGTYTVTERENWSWQYTLTSNNNVSVNGGQTVKFTNTRKDINWLGASFIVPNVFEIKEEEEVR